MKRNFETQGSLNSGAPAGAEGARGRSSIPIEIGKSIKPRKFGGRPRPYVRPYGRTHGLGLGTSLSLSLIWRIWSPSYAKSNTKTFFGLLRVNLNVIETCKNTVLLQRFFFLMFSHDLDISFQLKRSGCMKRRQIVGTLFTF